ncbi:MAG: metal ABC transporter substrate-binding protein, partial [Comamonas sp.]
MSATYSFAASRRAVLATAAAALLVTVGASALAQDSAKKNLLIGATAGSNYDLLQKGILPQLQK